MYIYNYIYILYIYTYLYATFIFLHYLHPHPEVTGLLLGLLEPWGLLLGQSMRNMPGWW